MCVCFYILVIKHGSIIFEFFPPSPFFIFVVWKRNAFIRVVVVVCGLWKYDYYLNKVGWCGVILFSYFSKEIIYIYAPTHSEKWKSNLTKQTNPFNQSYQNNIKIILSVNLLGFGEEWNNVRTVRSAPPSSLSLSLSLFPPLHISKEWKIKRGFIMPKHQMGQVL